MGGACWRSCWEHTGIRAPNPLKVQTAVSICLWGPIQSLQWSVFFISSGFEKYFPDAQKPVNKSEAEAAAKGRNYNCWHLLTPTDTSCPPTDTCWHLLTPAVTYWHLLTPAVTYWHLLTPAVTYWHLLTPAVTYWHLLTPADTSWHLLTPADTYWHQLTPTDTYWHQLTPTDTSWTPTDTSWHLLTPADTYWHQLTPADTSWHQLTPTDTSWHLLTPADTYWHQLTPTDTSWHLLTPADTYWHQLTPTDTSWHLRTPADTYWHQLTPADTSWHLRTPADTYGHQLTPTDTSWHLLTPADTYGHQLTPTDTSWHLLTPADTYLLPFIYCLWQPLFSYDIALFCFQKLKLLMLQEPPGGEEGGVEEENEEVVRRSLTGTVVCRRSVWAELHSLFLTGVFLGYGTNLSLLCFRGTFPGTTKSFVCTSWAEQRSGPPSHIIFFFRDGGREVTWKDFVNNYLSKGAVRGTPVVMSSGYNLAAQWERPEHILFFSYRRIRTLLSYSSGGTTGSRQQTLRQSDFLCGEDDCGRSEWEIFKVDLNVMMVSF